jgi:hypothetical protein
MMRASWFAHHRRACRTAHLRAGRGERARLPDREQNAERKKERPQPKTHRAMLRRTVQARKAGC